MYRGSLLGHEMPGTCSQGGLGLSCSTRGLPGSNWMAAHWGDTAGVSDTAQSGGPWNGASL